MTFCSPWLFEDAYSLARAGRSVPLAIVEINRHRACSSKCEDESGQQRAVQERDRINRFKITNISKMMAGAPTRRKSVNRSTSIGTCLFVFRRASWLA